VAIVRKIAIDFDEPAAQVFANDAGLNLKLEMRRCGAFTVADHMRAAAADTVHSRTSYFERAAFGIISVTTGLTELVTDAVVGLPLMDS